MRLALNIKQLILFPIVGLPLLAACSSFERFPGQNKIAADKAEREAAADKAMPAAYVSVSCVGHEGVNYISAFYVQEAFGSRMAGGGGCGGCGGLVAAGYRLPQTWLPGMKVKVRWKPNGRDWVEKYTTIRPYAEAGTLYVHFFANDEVRVVASALATPRSSKHPIPESLVVPPAEIE